MATSIVWSHCSASVLAVVFIVKGRIITLERNLNSLQQAISAMGGGAGGGQPPSFCQIFAKSPFFASNFSISMPTAPSRSSQPPHFQIHSAIYECWGIISLYNLKQLCMRITPLHYLMLGYMQMTTHETNNVTAGNGEKRRSISLTFFKRAVVYLRGSLVLS